MKREQGTLIRWDNAQGYGFIHPKVGNKDIFLHVASLPHYQRRPKIGDVLIFDVEVDDRGRYYATSTKIKGLAWSSFTLAWGCLILLFAAYVYLIFQQILPFHPAAIYVAMSLLTIWAYSYDKRAAQLGLWRTREIKLHILEMLGGWPGALLAQIYYRHKVQKAGYLVIFWLIVLCHGILWYNILANRQKYQPYFAVITEKIQILSNTVKQETRSLLQGENDKPLSTVRKPTQSDQQSGNSAPRRSKVAPLQGTRIVPAIVKEIRPKVGVLVILSQGSEGIIKEATLVKNYSSLIKPGERIQVAVQAITFAGDTSLIELVLVDE